MRISEEKHLLIVTDDKRYHLIRCCSDSFIMITQNLHDCRKYEQEYINELIVAEIFDLDIEYVKNL